MHLRSHELLQQAGDAEEVVRAVVAAAKNGDMTGLDTEAAGWLPSLPKARATA
jgi:hypothetical protein